jgi:hypothetical protein
LTINGSEIAPGRAYQATLHNPVNEFVIKVIAPDRTTSREYNLVVK